MNDDYLTELGKDFKDDPDYQTLSREEKNPHCQRAGKNDGTGMGMGMGTVY